MTLIEVIVGVGILGVVSGALLAAVNSGSKAVSAVKYQRDLEDARNLIRLRLDCAVTADRDTNPPIILYAKTRSGAARPLFKADSNGDLWIDPSGDVRLRVNSLSTGPDGALDVQVSNKGGALQPLFRDMPFVCKN